MRLITILRLPLALIVSVCTLGLAPLVTWYNLRKVKKLFGVTDYVSGGGKARYGTKFDHWIGVLLMKEQTAIVTSLESLVEVCSPLEYSIMRDLLQTGNPNVSKPYLEEMFRRYKPYINSQLERYESGYRINL